MLRGPAIENENGLDGESESDKMNLSRLEEIFTGSESDASDLEKVFGNETIDRSLLEKIMTSGKMNDFFRENLEKVNEMNEKEWAEIFSRLKKGEKLTEEELEQLAALLYIAAFLENTGGQADDDGFYERDNSKMEE